jgi:hypothetical protein
VNVKIDYVPLKVLIVDPFDPTSQVLAEALTRMRDNILLVRRVSNLSEAKAALIENDINTIYIDPISLGLETATDFIFETREALPGIEFVLYMDFSRAEGIRSEFYSGKRKRFSHYFRLNKLTPIASFSEELESSVRECQFDLRSRLTQDKISKLQGELSSISTGTETSAESVKIPIQLLKDISDQLESLKTTPQKSKVRPKTVFLSYRFAETDYVEGLRALLDREGFPVVTGENADTFISQAILDRIRSCEFFLCLMTQTDEKKDGTFTTSTWLLEEKGAALAMGKRIVLMVEVGVNDIGGLQGDWQRINFTSKSFTVAAIRAVDQLKSYAGQSSGT